MTLNVHCFLKLDCFKQRGRVPSFPLVSCHKALSHTDLFSILSPLNLADCTTMFLQFIPHWGEQCRQVISIQCRHKLIASFQLKQLIFSFIFNYVYAGFVCLHVCESRMCSAQKWKQDPHGLEVVSCCVSARIEIQVFQQQPVLGIIEPSLQPQFIYFIYKYLSDF